jgi:hypothetical protein
VNGWDNQGYVKQFSQTHIGSPMGTGTYSGPEWWQSLVISLRAETDANALETGVLARGDAASGTCQQYQGARSELILRCAAGSAMPVEVGSTLPPTAIPADPLWWALALMLLAGAYAWNCLAFCRLFNLDYNHIYLPLLAEVSAPAAIQGHLLVLGLPMARKDFAVRQWLGYAAPRVNLYEEKFSGYWRESTCTRLNQELRAMSGEVAQAAAAGGGTVQPVRAAPVKTWVHISNLESKICDQRERQLVADLLEKLLLMDIDGTPLHLIITSNVDPVFHFDSVLSDERKKIYEHPMPELELQRWARLLHSFRKVRALGPQDARPPWAETNSGPAIYEECHRHPELLCIGEEVAASATSKLRQDTILAMITERATALYKLFWASCTRSEKLLLIQVAQTGPGQSTVLRHTGRPGSQGSDPARAKAADHERDVSRFPPDGGSTRCGARVGKRGGRQFLANHPQRCAGVAGSRSRGSRTHPATGPSIRKRGAHRGRSGPGRPVPLAGILYPQGLRRIRIAVRCGMTTSGGAGWIKTPPRSFFYRGGFSWRRYPVDVLFTWVMYSRTAVHLQ